MIALLEVVGVTVRFGGLQALGGVEVEVREGEIVGLIGPNGAGKTTIFDLISGHLPLDGGRLRLLGTDITELAADRRAALGLGRSFQDARLFPALTVEENVVLAAQGISGGKFSMFRPVGSRRSLVDRARNAIERMGLASVAATKAAELGHGQQRQLELAIALAGDPKVLLLDEPGAGLSAAERSLMRDLVRGLPDEITVLLIEHDMELALGLADFVICMHNGKPVAEGAPDDIKANTQVQDIYLGRGQG